ncbi:transmembrane channel-like protein 6 [Stegostoma tigrinum]|uniref:transmembrane channel-like protein 6 n=1 Tax=Stegostoma tigrinum TaxID=3053191 RepID=UPI002870095D|nr:transmembrane channel-like protein 6 [Stegostoma tigrinum]XP_059509664.1 transmembrane channel-like protein 6 [Stegostoma tigrinum]XP_059509665.1 transmembrane channel-like protein 6 [Stegostoma tigrinum]XP_059509666.1 transmembrane channel-like protein 6 [Stegostoma tigrinum]
MAHSIDFHIDTVGAIPVFSDYDPASPDSCFEEDMVHDSFAHLISEQSALESEPSVMIEMEDLPGAGIENVGYFGSALHAQSKPNDDCYDPATLKVLSFMPSRTIGRSRGAIISEYYNRTLRLRRQRARPALKDMPRSMRPSIRDVAALDENCEEELEKKKLLTELQQLTGSECTRMLRTMPLNLSVKRELRRMTSNCKDHRSVPLDENLSCWSHTKYSMIIAVRQCWYGFLSFLYTFHLRQIALKQISGRFGTGVLSYFNFLKMLLIFNAFHLVMNIFFIVIPQATHPPEVPEGQFLGLELLTGIGYFTDTVLYYGYYTNTTWSFLRRGYNNSAPFVSYNMPIAYIYTIGGSFFITCIILVHCLSKAFGESYRVGSTYGNLVTKVFCSWDFKVTQKQSVESNYENISTQLKESLTEHKFRASHSSIAQWLLNLTVHILGWMLSLGSVVGCAVGIHYYSERMLKDYSQDIQQGIPEKQVESRLLTLPLIVSLINLVMPYVYNLIGLLEKYDFPQQQIYVSITRNLLLKLAILGPLCFHWMGSKLKATAEISCWETFVGQEIYRLLVVDFIFIILDTVFGEYVWRVICIKLLKRKRKPEFDIARNVLDLIFGQTLTWLGLVFAPLLPAIQMMKFIVVFYIKKLSLMKNCQPPHKLWRASHMMTIFISLLCFPSFLGATVVYSYTMWYLKPSLSCGPFRTLGAMCDSVTIWVQKLDENGPKFFKYSWILVRNPFIFFLASGILLVVIYFHCQVVDGQRKIIKLLNEQIANEGDDKKFLIDKLQDFNSEKFKFLKKRRTQREDEVYPDNY